MRSSGLAVSVMIILAFSSIQIVYAGSGTRTGDDAYILGPLRDITTVNEDEPYLSGYFAVMGDIVQNSFTGPDWLSVSEGTPLSPNTTGLEARWTFDQRNGDDFSGNMHHGIITGAQPDSGVFGIGSSMAFDGDDYITIPHHNRLNITDEITVEAWIYPTFSDSGEHMIISKGGHWGDDDPQDYELTIDKDRPLFQIKVPGSNDWYGAAPQEPITKNTWHHVAGVYDGYLFKIYIDGINQTALYNGWSGDYMGHIYTDGLPTSTHNISIGRREPASWGSLFYEGNIDEVRIFDRALDDEEILEHATRPGTPTLLINGTPDNSDVGDHQITVSITSSEGYTDERRFTIKVDNVKPNITTEDVTTAVQDQPYSVEYDADDEGVGNTAWSLVTEASFLSIDTITGLLSGTPGNDDVGEHDVRVGFSDGNGGVDDHVFVLNVTDVNDAPTILTYSIPNATEDEPYLFVLAGYDMDGEILSWTFETDAEWINGSIDGLLSGTPANDDVGTHTITARLTDQRGLFVEREFNITVFNVNDDPVWTDVPDYVTVDEGDLFTFDVNATDVDRGDVISYSVMTYPETNLSINEEGVITWRTSRTPFEDTPYNLTVKIEATDGESTIFHNFYINVIPNPSPITTLLYPEDGTILADIVTDIAWSIDETEYVDLIYRVYFSDTRSDVTSLDDDAMIQADRISISLSELERGTTYYWTVIAFDGFSNGTCSNGVFSFYVNTPPTTNIIHPIEGSRHSASEVKLSWNSFDIEEHNMTHTVYFDENEYLLETGDGMANMIEDIEDMKIIIADLEPGKTYYWTVIPEDTYNTGTCTNGVMSFKTNAVAVIDDVDDVTIEAGIEISIDINATDADDEIKFYLVDPVEGMFINEDTGMFIWTPKETQVGTFMVTVRVTDDIDEVLMNFSITVNKKEEEKKDEEEISPVLIGLIAGAIILLVIIALVISLIFWKKRKKIDEGGSGDISPIEEPMTSPVDSTYKAEPTTGPVAHDVVEPDTKNFEGGELVQNHKAPLKQDVSSHAHQIEHDPAQTQPPIEQQISPDFTQSP